jgi:hypothetical protein
MEKKDECCTPKGQVPRYVDCIGCDKKHIETMSKQTALDWYIEQEQILGDKLVDGILDLSRFNDEVAKLKIQAKQMWKEQIENAYQKGRFSGQTNWGYGNNITAEQYYNETYGG